MMCEGYAVMLAWLKTILGRKTSLPRVAPVRVVSNCKQWRCPGCNVLLEKAGLGTVWLPGEDLNAVAGTATCSKCGQTFPQAAVYGGAYDYVTTAGTRTATCSGCGAVLKVLPDVQVDNVVCPGCGTWVELQ